MDQAEVKSESNDPAPRKRKRTRIWIGLSVFVAFVVIGHIERIHTTEIDVQSGKIRDRREFMGIVYVDKVSETEFSKVVQSLGLTGSTEDWRGAGQRRDALLMGTGYWCGSMGSGVSNCYSVGDVIRDHDLPEAVVRPLVERMLSLLQRNKGGETHEVLGDLYDQVEQVHPPSP